MKQVTITNPITDETITVNKISKGKIKPNVKSQATLVSDYESEDSSSSSEDSTHSNSNNTNNNKNEYVFDDCYLRDPFTDLFISRNI